MNKFYVTKEIAEKLRTKGYNVEELHYENSSLSIDEVYQTDNLRIYKFPRIDEVLAWLREEKNIHIGFGYSPRKKWRHVVMYMDDRFYNKPTLTVDGFLKIEQAAIAGISYIIDNLI